MIKPDYTPEAQAIAERGLHGTESDYDRAHAELVSMGLTDEEAQYAIMSAGW